MAIWRGVGAQTTGPVNLSGGTSLTLYEFALTVAEAFNLDAALIDQISSQALTGLAHRPMQASFALKRMIKQLGFEPMSPAIGLLATREQEV
jgi:dTDP-4-dehydrorhamnose reductase